MMGIQAQGHQAVHHKKLWKLAFFAHFVGKAF